MLLLVFVVGGCGCDLATDFESWMRQIPFNVLTFEAVTHGILDVRQPPMSPHDG